MIRPTRSATLLSLVKQLNLSLQQERLVTSSTERLEKPPLDMLQNVLDEVVGLVSAAAQLPVGLAGAGRAVVNTAVVALELNAVAAAVANLNAFDRDAKAERCAGYRENAREGVARRKTPSSLLVRGMQWGLGGVVW